MTRGGCWSRGGGKTARPSSWPPGAWRPSWASASAAPGGWPACSRPFSTVEEAYLLSKLLRAIDPQAMLVLGPVPAAGGDERFPGFLVDAEKCPNRRGVEAILAHFTHRVETLEQLLPALDAGQFGGVWVAGGYKSAWIDAATAERFRRLALLVVQDLFPSPLSELAGYELPAAAFAERDGSYVNRHDRLQTVGLGDSPPLGRAARGRVVLATLRWPRTI